MKKFFVSLLAVAITVMSIPHNAFASNSVATPLLQEAPGDFYYGLGRLINVEEIDGGLYFDFIEDKIFPYDQPEPSSYVGKCPNKYKTTRKVRTRQELISMRNSIKSGKAALGAIVGLLIGSVHPVVGAASGYVIGESKDLLLSAIEKAIDNTYKSKYTIISKFRCEQGNLGQRGIVHRYRLVEVRIK